MEGRWVEDLRDECVAAKVPFFFKQWGGRTPKAGGRELGGREWDEMPGWGGGVINRTGGAEIPRVRWATTVWGESHE